MRSLLYIFVFTVLFGAFLESTAQNLVPNYSFETYSSCPTNFSQLNLATPWYDPTSASSDYFNACNLGSQNVPFSSTGFQYARTGVAYAGIYALNGLSDWGREYLQIQLSGLLQQDSCYLVEFYCNLYNKMKYSIKDFGLFISDTAINYTSPSSVINCTPQIISNQFLSDTLNWTRVFGYYTAHGGEQYITIGNFKPFSTGDTLYVGGDTYPGAYYYIEDVRVEKMVNCDTAVGIVENTYYEGQIKLYPNPTNSNLFIEYSIPQEEQAQFVIYDITGKELFHSSLKGGAQKVEITDLELSNGVYLFKIISGEKILKQDKLTIVK